MKLRPGTKFWFSLTILTWGSLHNALSNEQILHSFGVNADGAYPRSGLTQSLDGTLYGTTTGGGSNNFGVIFQIGPDGTDYRVLHRFAGGTNDGIAPSAGVLLGPQNSLYGVTSAGGISNAGVVFKIDQAGANYNVLHHFGLTVDDGVKPTAALVLGPDGALYGTTAAGGISGLGTVFRIDPLGGSYRVLHTFNAGPDDGSIPDTGVVADPLGTLYGTATAGGTNAGSGVLFKLNCDGTGFGLLHSFGSATNNGIYPRGLVLGHDGNLYGTTVSGGLFRAGAVFRVKPDGTAFTVIASFPQFPRHGFWPTLMQAADGRLFGAAGTSDITGPGFAFGLNTNGTGFGYLHIFASFPEDGLTPYGPLIEGMDGALYGTTYAGGTNGVGTIFRLTTELPAPPPFLLSITSPAATGVHISTDGVFGSTYTLQFSTNLLNWFTVGTISNETGIVDFLDWHRVPVPVGFYRMIQTSLSPQ